MCAPLRTPQGRDAVALGFTDIVDGAMSNACAAQATLLHVHLPQHLRAKN